MLRVSTHWYSYVTGVSVLVEAMSRYKCFFQVRISHILLFISICDLFTDCPSNIVSSGESDHKEENILLSSTQWLKCYIHVIFGKTGPSRIYIFFLLWSHLNLKSCIKLCKSSTLSYSHEIQWVNGSTSASQSRIRLVARVALSICSVTQAFSRCFAKFCCMHDPSAS
jgi:hypothetical protein